MIDTDRTDTTNQAESNPPSAPLPVPEEWERPDGSYQRAYRITEDGRISRLGSAEGDRQRA